MLTSLMSDSEKFLKIKLNKVILDRHLEEFVEILKFIVELLLLNLKF